MKYFHICCLTNNIPQYEEMKASFLEAGFDEERCRYTLLDNSVENVYEPKGGLDKCLKETAEPFLIYCHQDILLNQGHGFDQLLKVMQELDEKDPDWAIAGNAGVNNRGELVLRLTDPHGAPMWDGGFPSRVHTLDENFLVINPKKHIEVSEAFRGYFHLWATDLCMDATFKGYSIYVVDFHLEHLSKGKFRPEVLLDLSRRFQKIWSDKFVFCYVRTTYGDLFLSKYPPLRWFFSKNRVKDFMIEKINQYQQKQRAKGKAKAVAKGAPTEVAKSVLVSPCILSS
ncbi:MAG: hypothetical protein ACWA44_14960 [Thiotrichales bacterium]